MALFGNQPAVSPAAPAAGGTERITHEQRGAFHYSRGDKDTALQHYLEAARLAPEDAGVQKVLADLLVGLGKTDQALEAYERVLSLTPDDCETLHVLGNLCTSVKRFEDARRCYAKALHIEPWNTTVKKAMEALPNGQRTAPGPDLFKGMIRDMQRSAHAGEDDGVEAALDRLVSYKREAACAYQPGPARSPGTHDVEEALRMYLKLLTAHPKDVDTLTAIGNICAGLDRTTDALFFFDKILEIEPWNASARQRRDALRLMDRVGTQPGETPDKYEAILALAGDGRTEEALPALERFVRAHPQDGSARNDLGVLYYQSGRPTEALAQYEEAVRLEPGNATLQKNLADFYFVVQGKTQEALHIYVQLLSANPKDVETLTAIGRVCESLGRMDDAQGFYQKAAVQAEGSASPGLSVAIS